jgi:prepilin-type N-terminal cleavage/methylation domain-containing protein/prepilin-type processing-associated H-X9-DG protein
MYADKKYGFTLIELLVTISIIAVLAAMLLPALASARKKGYALNCQSNLHQLAVTTFLYAEDNNDSLPFAWYDNDDPSQNNFLSLFSPLLYHAEFDGYSDFGNKVFSCPKRTNERLAGPNPMRISYGMNAYTSASYPDAHTRRLASVPSPAKTMLIADVAYDYNHTSIERLDPDQVGYKHDNKANFAFFDGHVAAVGLRQTNDVALKF